MRSNAIPSLDLVELPWHATARALLDCHPLVLFVGGPGVGKTTFARSAARAATGREAEVVQGTPETELSHVWGFFSLDADATRFCDGPLPRALKEARHLVIEEFNLVPLEVRASLLALRGQSAVTNPFTGEVVSIPEAFRLVATSNPESLTCRRNTAIADALLDDFLILEVPRLTRTQMEELLRHDAPEATETLVQSVLDRWDALSEVGSSEEVRLGYRAAQHLLRLRQAGVPEGTATEVALANRYIVDSDAHATAKLRISFD